MRKLQNNEKKTISLHLCTYLIRTFFQLKHKYLFLLVRNIFKLLKLPYIYTVHTYI